MNRGINDGKDLPREYLESIYNAIETKEIKMKHPQKATNARPTTLCKQNISIQQLSMDIYLFIGISLKASIH